MIAEDLDVFLSDFGVSVTAGAVSGIAILDMPGESIMDDMVISTGYMLTARADEFGDLGYGDAVTADGATYVVQENKLISDGKFCRIQLEKVITALGRLLTLSGDVMVTLDGRYLVTL